MASTATPQCTNKSYPCGQVCIPRAHNCTSKMQESAITASQLVQLIAKAGDTRATEREGGNAAVAQKQIAEGRQALQTNDEEKLRQLALSTMNTLSPADAKAVLDKQIPAEDGQLVSLEQFADSIRNKPSYEPNSGAKAKDEANRQPGDKSAYELPGSKLRQVADAEVDDVWSQLGTEQRDWLFPANAGAPKRDEPPSRIAEDWGNNIIAMRKAMLKTLLEQTTIDENGDAYVHDPWSPTGRLTDPAPDLDHIVPLARGGTHGPAKVPGQPPEADSGSSNWVWTSRSINQTYKGDRDIPNTVDQLKLAAYGDGKKSAEELYESKVKAQIANIKAKVAEADLQDEIYNRMANGYGQQDGYFASGLPSLDEWDSRASNADLKKAMLRGLEQAGTIPKGTTEAWKSLPSGYQNELGRQLVDRLNTDAANAHEVYQRIVELKGGKAPAQLVAGDVVVPLDVLRDITAHNGRRYDDLSDLSDVQQDRFKQFVDRVRPDALKPEPIRQALSNTNGDYRKLNGSDKEAVMAWLKEQKLLVKQESLSPERKAQLATSKARSSK